MKTNTGCTVINMLDTPAGERFFFTYLGAVFWEPRQARNINTSGIANADKLRVFIPFAVDAEGKMFVPAKEFEASQGGFWTIESESTWIVKGRLETTDMKKITRMDDAFRVSTIDTKDFGTYSMRHWELGAK